MQGLEGTRESSTSTFFIHRLCRSTDHKLGIIPTIDFMLKDRGRCHRMTKVM